MIYRPSVAITTEGFYFPSLHLIFLVEAPRFSVVRKTSRDFLGFSLGL